MLGGTQGTGKAALKKLLSRNGAYAIHFWWQSRFQSRSGGGKRSAHFQKFKIEDSPHSRRVMPKKIDPLNKKQYGSVTTALTVTDVKAAASFYQKAFGFAKRAIMNGPDGKAMHAELALRGTTLMLGPEVAQMGTQSAKTLGASPTTLYLLTEDADKMVAKAVKTGATAKGPVMDMFWGDRVGTVIDPEGYTWMIATHIAEPTPQEMKKKMKEQMASEQAGSSSTS